MRYFHQLIVSFLILFSLFLTACSATGLQETEIVPTASPLPPTATAIPTPTPTAFPTEVPRTFITYNHPSGVFSISLPDDWEILDSSTTRQISTRFLPPVGFGSRIIVEANNEGVITINEARGIAESYIQGNYRVEENYTELNRADLPDGLQVIFRYDDGAGASGQETLIIRYTEPYLVALRVFLADQDALFLSNTLQSSTESLSVDGQSIWGGNVAAVNPAELILTNTRVWQGRSGEWFYTGELYNVAPTTISAVQIRLGICNETGAILSEIEGDIRLARIDQNEKIPFAVSLGDSFPEDAEICSGQATAIPAPTDENYTRSLTIKLTESNYHQWRKDLTLIGEVINNTLTPITGVEALIAVYDADSFVIGLFQFSPEIGGPLQPGQAIGFEVVISDLGGIPTSLGTLIEGYLPGGGNPSLIPTPEPATETP